MWGERCEVWGVQHNVQKCLTRSMNSFQASGPPVPRTNLFAGDDDDNDDDNVDDANSCDGSGAGSAADMST